ncbi:hypothetical protein EVAR_5994_1 [Eumeta japonica]|uniref:Uncharacterized protein n=1 Tax=Eumeta variegata TaxID=151549 RepID=A0A4C1T9F4_EUMVA|nr:hypothetical protein EVAR_5994_1 [Eumeta japonica]
MSCRRVVRRRGYGRAPSTAFGTGNRYRFAYNGLTHGGLRCLGDVTGRFTDFYLLSIAFQYFKMVCRDCSRPSSEIRWRLLRDQRDVWASSTKRNVSTRKRFRPRIAAASMTGEASVRGREGSFTTRHSDALPFRAQITAGHRLTCDRTKSGS